jgi:hypothetical protein
MTLWRPYSVVVAVELWQKEAETALEIATRNKTSPVQSLGCGRRYDNDQSLPRRSLAPDVCLQRVRLRQLGSTARIIDRSLPVAQQQASVASDELCFRYG